MLVGLEAHRFAREPGDDGSAWEESASHPTSPFVLGKGSATSRVNDSVYGKTCMRRVLLEISDDENTHFRSTIKLQYDHVELKTCRAEGLENLKIV